ncbi:MAG: polymer-forming cytoskeletal protein [Chthoniobacterales bacterium]
MAKSFRTPRKISVGCPWCGGTQQEPPEFIKTICRHCGQSFSREAIQPRKQIAAKSLAAAAQGNDSLRRRVIRFFRRADREVHCYRCGHDHVVSGYAKGSNCPTCSTYIGFSPLVVTASVSRNELDIRAKLTVKKNASLNVVRAICSSADLLGQFFGMLYCEKTLTIFFQGALQSKLAAEYVVLTKEADISSAFPLQAGEVEVRGMLRGDIVASRRVRLRKGARVEGDVYAKSLAVDNGAEFLGTLHIRPEGPDDNLIWRLQSEIPELRVAARPRNILRPGSMI